jgi:hypothetical protein
VDRINGAADQHSSEVTLSVHTVQIDADGIQSARVTPVGSGDVPDVAAQWYLLEK